jgi:hypothetical protein
MLNPVLAALFALGVVLCLMRFWETRNLFLLLWWQVTLLAGYYSIEAPQAYRTIGAIPVVLLFAGRSAEVLWRQWLGRWKDSWKPVALFLALAAIGAGCLYEIRTYFVKQAEDPGVWAEFSTAEYLMGKDLEALAPHAHGLVRPDWAESFTFRFVTYPDHDYENFDPTRHVPFQQTDRLAGKDLFYVLDQSYQPLAPLLKGFYPSGIYREVHHPMTNEVLYWTYQVPSAEASKPFKIEQGLTGHYYASQPDGTPAWDKAHLRFVQRDPFILFNWTDNPIPGYFAVEWTGHLKVDQAGLHRFFIYSNDQAELELDGRRVVSRPHLPDGNQWSEGAQSLSAGRHTLRLRYAEGRAYSHMEFWWQKPGGEKEVVPYRALFPD